MNEAVLRNFKDAYVGSNCMGWTCNGAHTWSAASEHITSKFEYPQVSLHGYYGGDSRFSFSYSVNLHQKLWLVKITKTVENKRNTFFYPALCRISAFLISRFTLPHLEIQLCWHPTSPAWSPYLFMFAFFSVQDSDPYEATEKAVALRRRSFNDIDILFFQIFAIFWTTLLAVQSRLLISCIQSPSLLIRDPRK